MRRARKSGDLLPPNAKAKGQRKTETPKRDLEDRIKILEDRIIALFESDLKHTLELGAINMCLRAAGELGQIEFDQALFESAMQKAYQIYERDVKKEFVELSSEEMLEIRYQEFKSENFEE